jgi:N-acetyl-gamma-glutamyl-phosphate reductase
MTRVGVVGATGYAGAELIRILSGHPEAELTIITSRQYAGQKFSRIYPAMENVVELVCEEMSVDRLAEAADLIFISLPHKLSMEIVPGLMAKGKKIIDLSADFRFSDVNRYEAVYQAHTAPDLLKEAVYGLSEIYFDDIRNARLIGNPGCYPTSVLLPLIPLLKKDFLDKRSLIADSKSGVSGAGRTLALTSHFCEVNESFKAYKVAGHRHTPEMEEVLSREAETPIRITFVPHLIPMSRGMLTTLYASLTRSVEADEIQEAFSQYYAKRPFIRLCGQDRIPDTLHVKGTNFCDIGFRIEKDQNRLILISAIDNLVKGAAGQAVQNMNIMLGLDEKTGLFNTPYPL